MLIRPVAVLLATMLVQSAVAPSAPVSAAAPPPVPAWAWCGAHPDDPAAATIVRSMAVFGGIDATFGPCKDGAPGYTAAEPGDRYVSPELYMRLVQLNATVGMKTIVYDKRVWSDDPVIRLAATTFWRPVFGSIEAWDLGDEFDPDSSEWAVLIKRSWIAQGGIAAESGIPIYTNHAARWVERGLRDVPGSNDLLSFDQYFGDQGVQLARTLDSKVRKLVCAVQALADAAFMPSSTTIRDASSRLIAAGCDILLVFGGAQVYGTRYFAPSSVVQVDGEPTTWATASLESSGASSYVPVIPARLLETRVNAGSTTIDGISNGVGRLTPGSTTALQIGGRGGVLTSAQSAVITVTAINPEAAGFVTVFPCDAAQPNSAQVTYAARAVIGTTVEAKLDAEGRICLFSLAPTDLVVDVNGYYPVESQTFIAVQPARLMETRVVGPSGTLDGTSTNLGIREAGSLTRLVVAGRAKVPLDARAASLSVTVTNPIASGFVSVYPCQQERPTTSSVNFLSGQTVTNGVITGLTPTDGTVCVYTSAAADIVIDIGGYSPQGTGLTGIQPVRLLDTRQTPANKADGASRVLVVGRQGVPTTAKVVILNLTVTQTQAAGFVTVYRCDEPRPNASSLNYAERVTVSNMVFAAASKDGTICLYSSAGVEYVVDATGYHL